MDPGAFHYDVGFSLLAFMRRDYQGAVAAARAVTELNPAFSAASKPYLAALGHLGDDREAAMVRRRLMLVEPSFTVKRFLKTTPLEQEADRDHFAEGLRLAGVPEA